MYVMIRDIAIALVWITGAVLRLQDVGPYDQGRQALDRGEWRAAVEAFEQLEDDAPEMDAALYWQAYAYNKIGDANRALDAIAELEERYPASAWRDDARALLAEVRGAYDAPAAGEDEDLKLMALNALMNRGDEDALPILKELLEGDHSARLKERALFVLAQSQSDEAFEILARVCRDSGSPELRRKALRYLGVHSNERSLALLSELYQSLEDTEARRVILRSFMVAGEKDRLLQVAKNEPDEELRRGAIRLLGTMNANDELAELYRTESSEDVRRGILQAFMVAGDVPRLFAVARNAEESESLRMAAIQLLSTQNARDELESLYQETDSEALQERIVRAFFVAGDTARLATIARDESTSLELRKAAIHHLGVAGEGSLSVLTDLYRSAESRELRERVLRALFQQQAVAELIGIARAESDVELKKRAVHWLSMIDSPEAKAFLLEILGS